MANSKKPTAKPSKTKSTVKQNSGVKLTFSKKSGKGKAKKKYGPKCSKPKAYKGQGR